MGRGERELSVLHTGWRTRTGSDARPLRTVLMHIRRQACRVPSDAFVVRRRRNADTNMVTLIIVGRSPRVATLARGLRAVAPTPPSIRLGSAGDKDGYGTTICAVIPDHTLIFGRERAKNVGYKFAALAPLGASCVAMDLLACLPGWGQREAIAEARALLQGAASERGSRPRSANVRWRDDKTRPLPSDGGKGPATTYSPHRPRVRGPFGQRRRVR